MQWLGRYIVKRATWALLIAAVAALMAITGVKAGTLAEPRDSTTGPAIHCDGVTVDEGTETCPDPTPTPTPTPTATPTPMPSPMVVTLSEADIARMENFANTIVLGIGLLIVGTAIITVLVYKP